MAVQPVLKQVVKGGNINLPLLDRYTHWDRVTPDDHEIRIGKYSLEKTCHEKICRSLLHADCLAAVSISMPTRAKSGHVLRRQ